MKERPISFFPPMIRAERAGLKRLTRRVVKLPANAKSVQYWAPPGGLSLAGWADPGVNYWTRAADGETDSNHLDPCPYGQPGDRLWVKEAHFLHGQWNVERVDGRLRWSFAADRDFGAQFDQQPNGFISGGRAAGVKGWWKRVGMFMPRWACRTVLEVVSVRIERLQDISEADAIAEGVMEWIKDGSFEAATAGKCWAVSCEFDPKSWARGAFAVLWESINGAGSWALNPWVWVVEFKRVTP